MATIETQRDVTGEVVPGVVVPTRRPRWRGLLRSRKLAAGLAIVGFFALVAVVGPLLVDDPNLVSDDRLLAPSAEHLLGTTTTGQDVFRQLVAATRGSMLVGLVVGLLATVVSVLVGVLGGYTGGHADESLSLVSNVFLVLPGLPLVVLITDYVQTRGALAIALIVSITAWAGSARVLRAQTLSLRSRDYVDAARVSGEPGWRIVTFEILPNLLPLIAAQFVFAVIGGILTEAALAFLGLGGAGSWGTMLYFAQNSQALSQGAWWWFVPPGLCIALVGAGLALINFSLDELINPRLRVTRRPRRTGPA
ncbi:ABC transporter permease [Plantactinospora sp. KLBMP9567]|uniref:ABC transporter permease n=1 Tax=Plantactinospora sp. KLBMP9567 TaxID=3085900 RepID=UPI002981D8CF|nr:ABC transporter permease [Plantactinospora sp. KLBMP9567]MDW5325791.1 ABC transporter permease [Plantactinospora sp. KLBMP9567]